MSFSSPPSGTEVPPLWPGSTIVCLGSGPSVCDADLDRVKHSGARLIAVNTMYLSAPWADVLYAGDLKWWEWHRWAPTFMGLKVTADFRVKPGHGVRTLTVTGALGLETDPSGVRTGGVVGNSGYQAINVAVHLGATEILLLGYDMQPGPNGEHHCHSDHPDERYVAYSSALPPFSSLVEPLKARGVSVVNCTRQTALHAFPERSLESSLP